MTNEWHEQIFCDRLECKVRTLDNGGIRMCNDGKSKAPVHHAVPDTQADQGVPAKNWIVVLFRNGDGSTNVFVRMRHQWELHATQYIVKNKWETIAECDTNIEAVEWARRYEKLLRE